MTDTNTETEAEVGTEAVVAVEPSVEDGSPIERRARLFGWKDKSEFDRPPERWVDAATYLARQETNLPILKENLHRLEGMVGTLKTDLDAARASGDAQLAAVNHLRDLTVTAETRAYERARRELESRRDAAAQTADVAGVRAASAELETLQPPRPAPIVIPQPVTTPAVDPIEQAAVVAFRKDNGTWFGPDRNATNLAVNEYTALQQRRPELSHVERLVEVRKEVAKRFPEHFQNPAAARPAAVGTPSGGGNSRAVPGKDGKWDSLPAEVKTVGDKQIADVNKGRKDGKLFTRTEYADLYLKANG